jgi:hypothetical protein
LTVVNQSKGVALSDGYNRVQLSTFVNGDQLVIRTDTGEELAEVAEGVAEHSSRIVKAFNAVKQVFVGDGIFTGDSSKRGASAPKGGDSRRPDTPPPATNSAAPGGGGGGGRTYLDVPFKDKDRAKAAGARFDGDRKQWYVTGDTSSVAEWLDD